MGCAPSAIGEESVSRCKQRKLLIKQVIVARSAFSAAHTAYAAALLTTGLAFRKYAHGEVGPNLQIPVFKRTVSMKESEKADLKRSVLQGWDYFYVHLPEVEDEELEFHTPDNLSRDEFSDDDDELEIPSQKQFQESEEFSRAINANWLKGLDEIYNEFLKASDCALQVTRLLHRKAAYSRDTIDHARRVMRVISWNPGTDDESYAEEPLAIVLYKLLEWENKLYHDVKAGELLKLEYQRKLVLLATQKRHDAPIELLVKTKADVRHARTNYMVELQLIDSTISELNNVRDRQLYPKLVELVEGMVNMWENMSVHHGNQLRIITDLKLLEILPIPTETTSEQYEKTTKLLSVVEEWRTQFNKYIALQSRYTTMLNTWLKINLIPIRTNLKEKLSSSSKQIMIPPIQLLVHSWHEYIEKLPHEDVKAAMTALLATLEAIVILQEEEIKKKENCDDTRKELLRKCNVFEDHDKCVVRKVSVSERRLTMEVLERRLEEETEEHEKLCLKVRAKSIQCLTTRLPEVLRAISDYSYACFDVYNRLMCIVALSEKASSVDGDPDS